MGWHVNNGPDRMATYYPASQFRKTLYRPDVIKRLLDAGSTARALAQADRQNGRPTDLTEVANVLPPKVSMLSPGAARACVCRRACVDVRAAAVPAGGRPVTSMRLLISGRPHPEARTLFRDTRPAETDRLMESRPASGCPPAFGQGHERRRATPSRMRSR